MATTSINRGIIAAIALVSVSLGIAARARADGPHFVGDLVVSCSGAGLSVKFKIGGLGSSTTTAIEAASPGVKVQCVNQGSNRPEGQQYNAFASGEFKSGKNGQIQGTLVLLSFDPCTDNTSERNTFPSVTVATRQLGLTMTVPGPLVCEE